MATGLANQLTAATSPTFQKRVAVALVVTARQVKAESATNKTVAQNRKRQQFADAVLSNPGSASETGWTPAPLTVTAAYALASAGLDDSSTDNAIQTALSGNWEVIAGFSQADG